MLLEFRGLRAYARAGLRPRRDREPTIDLLPVSISVASRTAASRRLRSRSLIVRTASDLDRPRAVVYVLTNSGGGHAVSARRGQIILSHSVVGRVSSNLISSWILRPGERLPSERELERWVFGRSHSHPARGGGRLQDRGPSGDARWAGIYVAGAPLGFFTGALWQACIASHEEGGVRLYLLSPRASRRSRAERGGGATGRDTRAAR